MKNINKYCFYFQSLPISFSLKLITFSPRRCLSSAEKQIRISMIIYSLITNEVYKLEQFQTQNLLILFSSFL